MKPTLLFMAALMLTAGLFTGCSDGGSTHAEAEEAVPSISEKLTQEESALIASAEADAKAEVDPASLETP
ncbi:MAG: hypothetical protein MPW15_04980 [Candidatus Manganitrophus sp.]|nr:hypothetical protein [Candidatus Manganitrophus sp.]